jgi:hypothetical protein
MEFLFVHMEVFEGRTTLGAIPGIREQYPPHIPEKSANVWQESKPPGNDPRSVIEMAGVV